MDDGGGLQETTAHKCRRANGFVVIALSTRQRLDSSHSQISIIICTTALPSNVSELIKKLLGLLGIVARRKLGCRTDTVRWGLPVAWGSWVGGVP